MRTRGFTLAELVVVIAIAGIIAASLAVFFKPAVDSYFDTRRRAEISSIADTALRRVGREVRRAVPNSVRLPSGQCLEFVPAKTGGLYRRAADGVNANSDPLDNTAADASFDVLSDLSAIPAAGDFVVIGNQNTSDLYAGDTRAAISAWQSPPAPGGTVVGAGRITLSAAKQFPPAYDGGRFFVVDQNERSLFFACRNVGESGGNGTGELLRLTQDFNVASACPAAGGVRLARSVSACNFVYSPGVTQQSGFVWMQIELLEAGERVALAYGMHVSNVP